MRRQLRIMLLDTSQGWRKILEVMYAHTPHSAPFLLLLATSIILGLPT